MRDRRRAGPPPRRGAIAAALGAQPTELLRYIALVSDRKGLMYDGHTHHHRHRHRRPDFARGRGPRFGRGGPRARRGDVRAAVLALLNERPMHGYEMIKELEERTDGAWVPSAGSIYPTLQMLEDEGLIRGEDVEGRRRFTLTESGEAEQREKAAEKPPWEAVRADAAPEMIRLGESVRKLHHAVRQVFHAADESQQREVRELLDETRRRIYAILSEAG
jgi:DNA-binding PadR family transcriptional regulator